MRHHGSIGEVELGSDSDFIVYGPNQGLAAECVDLTTAKKAFRSKLAEANERNVVSDLGIFRWSEGKWIPAVSRYEIQEWDLQRNPSRIIRYP